MAAAVTSSATYAAGCAAITAAAAAVAGCSGCWVLMFCLQGNNKLAID